MEQSTLYSYCHIVQRTDVGCVRAENEDWCNHFECANGLVAVVCDGMGGHVGGKVASHTAIEAIERFLRDQYFEDPRQAIIESINFANQAILNETERQPQLRGMGSTCVMLIVRGGKVYIGSVGDSRIYLIAQHRITQLTKDQSFVQMLVDAGQLTAEEAEHHPRKNEITNALGLPEMKPATVKEEPISPDAGFCFLLCSDGLSGMVSDSEIEKIVSNQRELKPQERADCLVELAKKNGGVDNITVQLVEFSSSPKDNNISTQKGEKTPDKPERNLLFPLLCIAAALALIIFIIVFAQKGGSEEGKTTDSDTTSTTIVDELSPTNTIEDQEKIGTFSLIDQKNQYLESDCIYPILKISKTENKIQFAIPSNGSKASFTLSNEFKWDDIAIDTTKFCYSTKKNGTYMEICFSKAFVKGKKRPNELDLVIEIPQGTKTRQFVLHITNINPPAEEEDPSEGSSHETSTPAGGGTGVTDGRNPLDQALRDGKTPETRAEENSVLMEEKQEGVKDTTDKTAQQ